MIESPKQRSVQSVVPSEQAMEGAGVLLRRAIGMTRLGDIDPFLLLDEFQSDDPAAYIAGFPSHPHRGIETVTYMLSGRMHHRDSTGGEGVITSGGVQWMTAGRGIIHSEMPAQVDGLMWGFQLWVNLPAAEKMRPAAYIELKAQDIPAVHLSVTTVRVIAGTWRGQTGPAPARTTEPLYLDIRMPAKSAQRLDVPDGHACFIYAYDGELAAGPPGHQTVIPPKAVARLSGSGPAAVSTERGASFLLIAGKPLNEPIARRGPFVMNTDEERRQAVADFQSGRLVDGPTGASTQSISPQEGLTVT
jgi:redox-sensitive bicupin YhaK (pirin superfamily)